jgi:hypothetical protein
LELVTGYQTSLHLVDVKIKDESLQPVRAILKPGSVRVPARLRMYIERVVLDSEDFLTFRASQDGSNSYCPFDDGTVPALSGKWYKAEHFATWLKRHSEQGGRMIQHSLEADGAAWGWEFDGRGRMRSLGLRPLGKWE